MRIAAFLLVLAMMVPAQAEPSRLLEPATTLTTEQQVNEIIGKAHLKKGVCLQVQRQRGLFAPDFVYLVDELGTKNEAEYRFVVYPDGLLRVSQLLKPDHSSTCRARVFVVDANTGKLDVGAYEACGGGHGPRLSDAFYYDREKKRRMGHEHKLRWDIAFRRLMWNTVDIAGKCTR